MPRFVKGLYDNTGTMVSAAGSTLGATSTLYIAPVSTALSESNNYYFTYLAAPSCSGSTTGTASTLYIAGAPSTTGVGNSITTAYALNVADGNCYIKGDLKIDGTLTAASGGGGASTKNPKLISTTTTLLTTDPTYVVATSGTFTITLPSIQTVGTSINGLQYYITNLGVGTVTLTTAGPSENFDGTSITSMSLYQYDRIFIIAINTGSQYVWQTY